MLNNMNSNQTMKQRVRIITVDPATRRIEGQLKDYAIVQIAVYEVPAQFRWPKEGEVWSIYRENTFWILGSPIESSDASKTIEDLDQGDTLLGVDGSTTHILGDITVSGSSPVLRPTPMTSGNGLTWNGTTWVDTNLRLTDARVPIAHKTTHATGGTDVLLPSDIGAAPLGVSRGGLLSAIGAAGTIGRHYYATDIGLDFFDTGTSWAPIGIPIGGGFDWFGAADPIPELMISNGRALSRSTYSRLFTLLGTTFGTGDGSTTFNIPNVTDRALVGVSSTIARGAAGGAKTHISTAAESGMPSHGHSASSGGQSANHSHPYTDRNSVDSGFRTNNGTQLIVSLGSSVGDTTSPANADHGHAITVNPVAAADAIAGHNNMQPYLGANKVIRVL